MLVPVRMASRGGHAPDVCYNRRFIKPDGTVHMVFNRQESPPDPAWIEQGKDDEVSVLRFDDLDGEALGAFINFGCHALCSTDKYGGISADYPRYVADVFGEVAGLPVVFAQGGLGDVVPIERDGLAARRVGRSVGAQALYVFEQIRPENTPTMETHTYEVEIPARRIPEEPEEMRFNFKAMHNRYHRFLYEWYEQKPLNPVSDQGRHSGRHRARAYAGRIVSRHDIGHQGGPRLSGIPSSSAAPRGRWPTCPRRKRSTKAAWSPTSRPLRLPASP